MLAGHEEQLKLIETARGERPADLFVRGGTIANVYSGELHGGNITVAGGRIAYVGEWERAAGRRLWPGQLGGSGNSTAASSL